MLEKQLSHRGSPTGNQGKETTGLRLPRATGYRQRNKRDVQSTKTRRCQMYWGYGLRHRHLASVGKVTEKIGLIGLSRIGYSIRKIMHTYIS